MSAKSAKLHAGKVGRGKEQEGVLREGVGCFLMWQMKKNQLL